MNQAPFLSRLVNSRSAGILPVIAEIKVSTPAAGNLLRQRSVEAIAQQYESANVACLSVVTGRWFGGSPALLQRVAGTTLLPILRKDFIVSRGAIDRSMELGASAVLLTRKLVSPALLQKLTGHALALGLTPFIEIASGDELQGLKLDSDAILAINNRDISSKETDTGNIATSLSLLTAARASGAAAVVSASAIACVQEAKQLLQAGFDGLLIGTAFLRAAQLDQSLNQFRDLLLGINS